MQTARRRGCQGEGDEYERGEREGECCEQVRGECVNIAPGRIEKQMSNENRKQREGRTTGSREGSGGTASRARTHIAGWSPFWEVGEFSAKGKVDGRTDGRTTSMSNVHKFMTSLPSRGGCHMDVCVCGWAVCCCSVSLLLLLLLLRVSSVYIVSLKRRPGGDEAATLQRQWADA